jgi:hypothetical protein
MPVQVTPLLGFFLRDELEPAREPPTRERADELGELRVQLLGLGIGFASYDSEPRRVVDETVVSATLKSARTPSAATAFRSLFVRVVVLASVAPRDQWAKRPQNRTGQIAAVTGLSQNCHWLAAAAAGAGSIFRRPLQGDRPPWSDRP